MPFLRKDRRTLRQFLRHDKIRQVGRIVRMTQNRVEQHVRTVVVRPLVDHPAVHVQVVPVVGNLDEVSQEAGIVLIG